MKNLFKKVYLKKKKLFEIYNMGTFFIVNLFEFFYGEFVSIFFMEIFF